VILEVSDTGIGMDDETKARLFEPFFTTKPPGPGTGLGLSTVYGIVTQSGGSISVESERGKGTTFRMSFPEHVEAAGADHADAARAIPAAGARRILLVEDDEAVRRVAGRVLERAGYMVRQAANGREALADANVSVEPYDLLIAGLATAGAQDIATPLRERWPTIRVLYIAAVGAGSELDPGSRPSAALAGAAQIEKPFTPLDLLAKVRDVLG
jgi:CheY-like chemotaxis protein